MNTTQRARVLVTIREIDPKGAETFVTELSKLDAAAVALQRAVDKEARARVNFSAAILATIVAGTSAGMVLAGVEAARGTHKADSGEYNQLNVALTRTRNAFRRISGADTPEAWNKAWSKIHAAAVAADTFTTLERGPASERGEQAARGEAPARVATLPPAPEDLGPADPKKWPPYARDRYAQFAELTTLAVREGTLTREHGDAVMSLVTEGMRASLAAPLPSFLADMPLAEAPAPRSTRVPTRRRPAKVTA